MRELDKKWNALPEIARWLLWFPLALLGTAILTLLGRLAIGAYAGFGSSWTGELIPASIASTTLLPLVYVLVPRFKKTITSVVFAFVAVGCLLTVARTCFLAFSRDEHITQHDLVELAQAAVWMTFGVGTFWQCLRGRFS